VKREGEEDMRARKEKGREVFFSGDIVVLGETSGVVRK